MAGKGSELQQQYDPQRLAALVHYVCYRCQDPSILGATKLNKVLWYADVLTYIKTGKPITGEIYVKHQYGPVSSHLNAIIEDLQTQGALATREVEFYGYPKKEFVALKAPNIEGFSATEISIIDSMIDEVCLRHTADTISKASHDVIWELAEIGEEIPYYAVLASKLGEITEADVKWAREALAKNSANVG